MIKYSSKIKSMFYFDGKMFAPVSAQFLLYLKAYGEVLIYLFHSEFSP